MLNYTKQDIINMVEEEDVKFIRLQFTDLFGHMKNAAIMSSQLEKVLSKSMKFDSSSIPCFGNTENSDMYLVPNLDTFVIFPWRPQQGKVARLICDIYKPDGTVFDKNPRYVLERVLKDARDMGYSFTVGPECEFFLFNTDDEGKPTTHTHDEGGYFDLAPIDHGENCRRDICMTLEEMGFEIEASHHEVAHGQHEVDFHHDDALTTADRIMTFKLVVKTIAKRHGLHATFMPKPITGEAGSGMHINMSLFKDGANVFYDKNDKNGLSETGYKFMAGILKYMPEFSFITNPIVNSYKRIVSGFEAPEYVGWSSSNRSLMVRVPAFSDSESARIELRNPDAAANPYLVIAACLACGLEGIKKDLPVPKSINVNMFDITKEEADTLGVESLPISLNAAIKLAANSDFVKQVLGEDLVGEYIKVKEAEYGEYRTQITKWETDKYLTVY
ncbi:MAG: type I glutamate--ammonia ligase [Oscillospiraceae bacterium]|nr:type I glutamate--ammonia ligase [Oscillospiraceae bacterium]